MGGEMGGEGESTYHLHHIIKRSFLSFSCHCRVGVFSWNLSPIWVDVLGSSQVGQVGQKWTLTGINDHIAIAGTWGCLLNESMDGSYWQWGYSSQLFIEDVFPIDNGDIPASYFTRGCIGFDEQAAVRILLPLEKTWHTSRQTPRGKQRCAWRTWWETSWTGTQRRMYVGVLFHRVIDTSNMQIWQRKVLSKENHVNFLKIFVKTSFDLWWFMDCSKGSSPGWLLDLWIFLLRLRWRKKIHHRLRLPHRGLGCGWNSGGCSERQKNNRKLI